MSGIARLSQTHAGWTVGGGLEWLFYPNWSVKVEYLYYDLGTFSANTLLVDPFLSGVSPAFFTNVARTTTRFNGNIVRAGLNYHFNWWTPSPIVAKY